jgi:hypothetical protein
MFGTINREMVHIRQAELLREAEERRLAARINRREQRDEPERRVLGLRIRLSLA